MTEEFTGSDEVKDFLEHHGVRGMKWGVRRTREGQVKARSTISVYRRKIAREETPLRLQSTHYQKVYSRTFRRASGHIRSGVKTINKDPRFKGKNFKSWR